VALSRPIARRPVRHPAYQQKSHQYITSMARHLPPSAYQMGVIFDEPPGVSLFFRLQSTVIVTDEVADLIGHRRSLIHCSL
jgi:hypothetical protein